MRLRPALVIAAVAGPLSVLCACGAPEPAGPKPVETISELPGTFTPTPGGQVLSFGQTARIVTANFDTGAPVYWDVTVDAPQTLSPAHVEQNIGQNPGAIGLPVPTTSTSTTSTAAASETTAAPPAPEPERYAKFTCFVAKFTPVDIEKPTASDFSVILPTLTAIDPGGLNANRVQFGDNRYCGIDGDGIPAFTGDMTIGQPYQQAIVTWEGADDPGIVGTAIRLSTTPSPRNVAQPQQSVRWQ